MAHFAQRNAGAGKRTLVSIRITDGCDGKAACPFQQEGAAITHGLAFARFTDLDDPRFGRGDGTHRVCHVIDRFAAIKGDAGAGEVEMIVGAEKYPGGSRET
ncbi:hypothetical protein D3C72_1149260 [compost metagenome]